MDKRNSGQGKIGRIAKGMMVLAVAVTAILIYPTQSARTTSQRSGDIVAIVQAQLGSRQAAQLDCLTDWPAERLERLNVWLTYGITFEGTWASEELDLMVTVLDGFGATYGEARFVALTEAAVEAASFGLRHHLRLVKAKGYDLPVTVWFDGSGRIRFNEGLFDDATFGQHYYWSFLVGEYAHPGPEVTMRHTVIGHELGHVLIDGLRSEAMATGQDEMALETLYEQMIEPAQWPHKASTANESLATELAVWALGVGRTAQVDALRAALSGHFAASDAKP